MKCLLVVLAGVALPLLGACSLSGLVGLSSGGPPSDVDASTVEDGETSDGGRADSAIAGPNVVPNPGFEEGDPAECGPGFPLRGFNATLSSTPVARSGARACRVCNDQGSAGDNFNLDPSDRGFADVTPGTYELEAWVRADPSGGDVDVSLALRVYQGDVEQTPRDTSPPTRVGQSWSLIRHVSVVDRAGRAELLVASPVRDPRTCFIADDLSLRRVE